MGMDSCPTSEIKVIHGTGFMQWHKAAGLIELSPFFAKDDANVLELDLT